MRKSGLRSEMAEDRKVIRYQMNTPINKTRQIEKLIIKQKYFIS